MSMNMFHINLDKTGKPYVLLVAENHEILSSTESFEQKQSAWDNMLAQLKAFNDFTLFVQDNSAEDRRMFSFKNIHQRETIHTDVTAYVHIWRSENDELFVTVRGKNHETLSTTQLFKSKHSAWKNIDAQKMALGGIMIPVQDNTEEIPVLYYLHETGEIVTHPGKLHKQPKTDR